MDLQTIMFLNIPLIEWIGFLFGVVGVYFGIKEKIAYFPISLVNVIVSLYIFYHQNLYSDVIQQGVYIILLSYGWLRWFRGNQNTEMPVTNASKNSFSFYLVESFY